MILSSLAKFSKPLRSSPRSHKHILPSLPEWGALINVCAGAITDSEFAILVQKFSSIFDIRENLRILELHRATAPEALARALLKLAKVSDGSVKNVTIEGGVDCGWLAAVAKGILGLRISILDSGRQPLYLPIDQAAGTEPQVTFICQNLASSISLQTAALSPACYVPRGISSFRINMHGNPESSTSQHFFSKGRSEWSTILHDTFGTTLDILLHPQHLLHLGIFLCFRATRF
jgi:hypothetical protein